MKLFKGSSDVEFQRGGQFHCHNSECYDGAVEADSASKMSPEERITSLVVDLQPSESEEESCEETTADIMEFDRNSSV